MGSKAIRNSESSRLIPPERLREDLDFLFKTIKEVHPNMYAYTGEGEFVKRFKILYSCLDHPMGPVEFYKLVAPFVASLKNGHTNVFPPLDRSMALLMQLGISR